MSTFKIKPIHPADAAEITVEADRMNIDNSSGRVNFFSGDGDAAECVGTFINVTAYKDAEPEA